MQKPTFKYYDIKDARKIANQFGAQTLNELAFSIANLSLVDKGELLKSLKFRAQKSEFEEIDRLKFTYNFYGIFLDIGNEKLIKRNWRNSILNPAWEKANILFNQYYASLIEKEIADDTAEALGVEIKIQM